MEVEIRKTRILIISDTHGEPFTIKPEHHHPLDVIIHCGDLTQGSTLNEYRQTLHSLHQLEAPLKLVLPGNHDFTLDTAAFERIVSEAGRVEELTQAEIRETYGDYGEVRGLFDEDEDEEEDHGRRVRVKYLKEGTHSFALANGTQLSVYASPFTPSDDGGIAFWYHPHPHPSSTGHKFAIAKDTDIVITHGPPLGILDRSFGRRMGCPELFAAVATARPAVHCFGHVHAGWGARRVAWRERMVGSTGMPSHFTDVDHAGCSTIATLADLERRGGEGDTDEMEMGEREKREKLEDWKRQGFCEAECRYQDRGGYTLFVNAAVKGGVLEDLPVHPAWIVELELPVSRTSKGLDLD